MFGKDARYVNDPEQHIVVLGGGFAGLTFCQSLRHSRARITLVDRTNHHLFQPLLYQVATAGLSAPEIAQPIRSILSDHEKVTVLLDEVRDIRLAERKVMLAGQTLEYDYLVIALGGATSYFGHPEWEQFAPGLKSLDDAMRIRRDVLLAFERAEMEADAERRRKLMTIAVVGGGPTGVELAGSFAELTRTVLKGDFRRINPSDSHVVLIENSPRLLGAFSEDLARSARDQLESLGVEVWTGCRVEEIREGEVKVSSNGSVETLAACNVIWAAGVGASPLTRGLGVETDRAGRIKVEPDLSLPGHADVFALGDLALVMDDNGKPVPGVSPAAIQMAQHTARTIRDELDRPHRAGRRPFKYWDKGSMATIGRSAAVAQVGKMEFSGLLAWLAWLFVHLVFLIGFRSKAAVLLHWIYSYCTYKRGARIVFGEETRPPDAGA